MASGDVEQSRANITTFIIEKLQNLPSIVDQECSIHRVPRRLLNMNCNAYIPKVISIGPFHHNQHNFRATEELKFRFFNSYQRRLENIINIQGIVRNVQNWEEGARKYYSEPINMESEEFVKMMILDGCFIVEFLLMDWKDLFPENKNKVHSLFYKVVDFDISLELIMLENQLPFFVLQRLFDLVYPTRIFQNPSHDSIDLFKQVVHNFLNSRVLPIKSGTLDKSMSRIIQNPRHLVDFLSFYFVPKAKKTVVHQDLHLPPNASQLREAGVVFKKVEGDSTCIMDISFKNGILKIPPIVIDDTFETCARNLLAFAQFNYEENKGNVIHYFEFLDELITSEKDVNLLVKEEIIMNHIGGSDREISELFNDICKNITVSSKNYYSNIAKDLKQHCETRRNRWMASLRHNYFNTPWTLISFLAATFLIVLTFLQTIFSGISTYK